MKTKLTKKKQVDAMMADPGEDKKKGATTTTYGNVMMEGWLLKRGGFNKSYATRYFRMVYSFRRYFLEYYKTKDAKKSQGSILITGATIEKDEKKDKIFRIKTKKRTYHLKAVKSEVRNDWVANLNKYVKEE